MTDRLGDLTEALLKAAKAAGATEADAMAVDGTAISVDVRQGVLEQAERSEGVEIGLRVMVGKRQAAVLASLFIHEMKYSMSYVTPCNRQGFCLHSFTTPTIQRRQFS